MSCTHPLIAIDNGIDELTGKHKLTLISNGLNGHASIYELECLFGKEKILLLPCGKCASCLLKRRREWSVRCALEASYHAQNCFITCTYDNDHCPSKLNKSDSTRFIKAIRNAGYKIRYFYCGEYGTETARPHFHFIIFGYMPSDLKVYSKSKSGEYLYISEELNKFWNYKGFVTVAPFSSQTASYVAGYVNKKLGDYKGFISMSTKPGIGRQYIEDNSKKVFKYDNIVIDGSISNVPRYFEKVAIQLNEIDFESLKKKRIDSSRASINSEMLLHGFTSKEKLFEHKDKVMKDKLERRKRKL